MTDDDKRNISMKFREFKHELEIKKINIFNFVSSLRSLQRMFGSMIEMLIGVAILAMSAPEKILELSKVVKTMAMQIQDIYKRLDKMEGK